LYKLLMHLKGLRICRTQGWETQDFWTSVFRAYVVDTVLDIDDSLDVHVQNKMLSDNNSIQMERELLCRIVHKLTFCPQV